MTTFNTETDPQTQEGSIKPDQGNANFEEQLSVLKKRMDDKDSFIEQLKKEAQEAREQAADFAAEKKQKDMEEILDEVRRLKEAQASSKLGTMPDTKELAAQVKQELEQEQTKKQLETNFKEVSQKLTSMFGGDKVDSKVREIAESNGLTYDDMIGIAQKSPKAIYRMMGIDQQAPQGSQFSQGSINTQGLPQTNTKDHAYYSKLRQENPMEYWKPEVQKEFRKLFQKDK